MTVIVAIDGPSGVGKSSTSKAVARRLHIPHIDTGAMYRAIALKAVRQQIALDDEKALARMSEATAIDFEPAGEGPARTILDGEDVSSAIRTPEIGMAASTVSAVPSVRRVLVRLQQAMGQRSGGVLEGRDIGTKVFPETPFKFFLTARPEVRAQRRHGELRDKGIEETYEKVLSEMEVRDRQDSTRSDSPLTWDESYELLDTSDLTIDQVVEKIVESVNSRSR